MRHHFSDTELIVFDLDGTLTETKSSMDKEMLDLFVRLLTQRKVSVISGGFLPQFRRQFVDLLSPNAKRENLFLFPTNGTRMYQWSGSDWGEVYAEHLTEAERVSIIGVFQRAIAQFPFLRPSELFGEQIEDRGTQVTFSALGQQAPTHLKKAWDPDFSRRLEVKKFLDPLLPDLEVLVAGGTSVDVTRRGIDKAYGIRQMEKHIGVPKERILFFGDALMEGGNDYPVIETGVEVVAVTDPENTKRLIQEWLSR